MSKNHNPHRTSSKANLIRTLSQQDIELDPSAFKGASKGDLAKSSEDLETLRILQENEETDANDPLISLV
jgi:hypothetical protein